MQDAQRGAIWSTVQKIPRHGKAQASAQWHDLARVVG